MKKTIKKGIVLAILFAMILVNAKEGKPILSKEMIKKTSLTLNNIKEGEKLVIKDNNGLILKIILKLKLVFHQP